LPIQAAVVVLVVIILLVLRVRQVGHQLDMHLLTLAAVVVLAVTIHLEMLALHHLTILATLSFLAVAVVLAATIRLERVVWQTENYYLIPFWSPFKLYWL
jgi:lysylphosphatidylglycerol synthetase-like protein (DUF2156 family)